MPTLRELLVRYGSALPKLSKPGNSKIKRGRPPGPRMPCDWGCRAKLTASAMRTHLTVCPPEAPEGLKSVTALLHVLPRGFVRIRHFGFFAHRRRAAPLPLCFQLLAAALSAPPSGESESISGAPVPLWLCPRCGGPMVLLERLTPVQARLR